MRKAKRYEHWLYKTGKGSWPPAVLCLGVDADWTREGCRNNMESASLRGWHTQLVYRTGNTYATGSITSGLDCPSFWVEVAKSLSRIQSLWTLSADTRVTLSLLGVWDGIEEGWLETAGKHARANAEGDVSMPRVRQRKRTGTLATNEQVGSHDMPRVRDSVGEPGRRTHRKSPGNRRPAEPLMILNDPPLMLQLQLTGHKGKIVWVDAANYGLSLNGICAGGLSAAAALAEWFIRAASTLQSLGDVGWRMTSGAQAMHLFRSHYLDTPILSHTHRGATALETAGIYGGRNECYTVGRVEGNVYAYDFRSLYPYICATYALPVRLVRMEVCRDVVELDGRRDGMYVVAEVDIETNQPWYPYRREKDVIYPVGRFTTTLGGEELGLAVRSGHVRAVRRCAVYEREPCLASYAEAIYAIRARAIKDGYKMLASWAKTLLVSLPGKFAQRDRRWITRPGADPLYEWGRWYALLPGVGMCRWRSIGGIVQVEMEGEYVSGVVPAITAAVCSAGRMRLLQAMLCCGIENVYYVDTDSIVTNDIGRESLMQHGWVRPGQLGYLQLEVEADSAEIYGLKHYRIGKKVRYAGQPGGGKAYYSAAGPVPTVPWIGASFYAHRKPAATRVLSTLPSSANSVDTGTATAVRIRPREVDEWEE